MRPAVGTFFHQHLPAHCAELSANRICQGSVRQIQISSLDVIRTVRRTARIRTEPNPFLWRFNGQRITRMVNNVLRLWLLRKVNPELFRQLAYYRVVQFCTITLLKHRKSGLLAADFPCNINLRKLSLSPCFLQLPAYFWIQIRHKITCYVVSVVYYGLYFSILQG